MTNTWPILSYKEGKATYDTLHMWTQIVGKIKLALLPWVNHSWHITLHITPTGLTSLGIPYNDLQFQIDFNFITHKLEITTSLGEIRTFELQGISVADFYTKLFSTLHELEIDVKIKPVPVEIVDPIPFKEDTVHATYDVVQVKAFHQALMRIEKVFEKFRAEFNGKCSPIHFFWGSFDLAYSRFSGRKAPKHPGGIPNLPDRVAEEAYSHEVSSCGFWTGSEAFPEAAFYAYIYPEPQGYKEAKVEPVEAYYNTDFREFILPYTVVQQSPNSDAMVLDFLHTTFNSCSTLARWDAALPEKDAEVKL